MDLSLSSGRLQFRLPCSGLPKLLAPWPATPCLTLRKFGDNVELGQRGGHTCTRSTLGTPTCRVGVAKDNGTPGAALLDEQELLVVEEVGEREGDAGGWDERETEWRREGYGEGEFEEEKEGEGEDEGVGFASVEYDEAAVQLALEFRKQMLAEVDSVQLAEHEKRPKVRPDVKGQSSEVLELMSPSMTKTEVPVELLPKVAIVGRPNVGKSALFNRIAGRQLAIVHDEPGITRDRRYTRSSWQGRDFLLVDTGGVLTPPQTSSSTSQKQSQIGQPQKVAGRGRKTWRSQRRAEASSNVQETVVSATSDATSAKEAHAVGLPTMIERQAVLAVEEADVLILVVDGQAGLTAADTDIAAWLRRQHPKKKAFLAVNKCESPQKGQMQTAEFWSLGLPPLAVSAISGTGTGDLLDQVCQFLEDQEAEQEASLAGKDPPSTSTSEQHCAIAIIGRPNVGKSSIVNAILGEERTIVSPMSGTTRDSIDTPFVGRESLPYTLIDTAGIRKRTAVAAAESRAEGLSVNRAFRAIRSADVVALVIDAMLCVTEQDLRLGEKIEREGKACVIVVNKWDTVPDKDTKTMGVYEEDVREKLRTLSWAPIVYTSANTGHRVDRILEKARDAAQSRAKRVSTATLNQVVSQAVAFRPMPRSRGGRSGKIYYCTQAATCPPTFVFFVNEAKLFNEDYRRYMEKQLRQNVAFEGTPIRLLWRSKAKRPAPGEEQPRKSKDSTDHTLPAAAQADATGDSLADMALSKLQATLQSELA